MRKMISGIFARKYTALATALIFALLAGNAALFGESLTFRGELDQTIQIDTAEEVEILLSNVSLSSRTAIPIHIKNARNVILVLEGTNLIETGAVPAIKSEAPLLIRGGGALRLIGKDDGINTVSLTVEGGNFNIDVGDDAIKAENELTIKNGSFIISSLGDAIHSDNRVVIYDGVIDIRQSYEGIEGCNISIFDGDIKIVSIDDGLNIAGDNLDFNSDALIIEGGFIEVDATADGIDSNASVYINGGVVLINGPPGRDTEGKINGALDYDNTFHMNGGLLVAVGDHSMAQAPSGASSVNSVFYILDRQWEAETLLHVEDDSSQSLITFRSKKPFQSFVVASPKLKSRQNYRFYIGGEILSSGGERGGLYTNPVYRNGQLLAETTITSSVSYLKDPNAPIRRRRRR